MPRVALDLNDPVDRQTLNGEWRVGPGLVPGEPNEGLTAQLLASPPREAGYDDSAWDVCANIRESLSVGFTFAWYRITVDLPQEVKGMTVEGARLWDAYSETPRLQTLKRARIRGIESSGMVCSEKELGLSDEHTGVLILDPQAPVGQPLLTPASWTIGLCWLPRDGNCVRP